MYIKKLVLGDLKKQVSVKSFFGRKALKSNIAPNELFLTKNNWITHEREKAVSYKVRNRKH